MSKVRHASVRPTSTLNLLSHEEMRGVTNYDDSVFKIFRQCALAVLNSGVEEDDAGVVFNEYHDFDIRITPQSRGIKLDLVNAPSCAFVNGKMIRGIQKQLFSALRDIVYTNHKITGDGKIIPTTSDEITDMVFRILRNAGVVQPNVIPKMVVCWGGHSISRVEYDYTKKVGYELGLRGLNIATGCGMGAMKGPMKGAVLGHGKQQISDGRYLGVTEPGIIASESPNPSVNELVILPDIEKRLEAFVRLSHAIIVFPGGAGTVEEILYLLGVLMQPENRDIPMPLIFAGPPEAQSYFDVLDQFIRNTLGKSAAQYYQIIVGSPDQVAQKALIGTYNVHKYRRIKQESYAFNWQLNIPLELQQPFIPTHENMSALKISSDQPKHILASELRCAFSGIVSGNVKADGIERVREHGPYVLEGEPEIMQEMDKMLQGFVEQGRMKLKGEYVPCYRFK
jgi:predicted Rossmann-fold nucleotide-binding protein